MTARTPRDPGYLAVLFGRNARRYDAVNQLISLGQVTLWRRELVRMARIAPGASVLDSFCGPGALGRLALPLLRGRGRLVFADVSAPMLEQARLRLARQLSQGFRGGTSVAGGTASADGTAIEFWHQDLLADDLPQPLLSSFDVVLNGFGLRYVTSPTAALQALARSLRPGGRLAAMEFTVPRAREPGSWPAPLGLLPQLYFRRLLPGWAALLAGDSELYDYLRDSSRAFLTPSGLAECTYEAGLEPESAAVHLSGLVTNLVCRRPVE